MATTMTDSVAIDVPPVVAWDFIADPEKFHGLMANSSVRLLSGTFDTVGSRFLVTTRAYGRFLDATHEIVRLEAPRVIETRITSEGTVMQSLVQVEPVREDACVLIVQSTIGWGGSFLALVSRVLNALIGRAIFSAFLERLKKRIEADHAGRPFPTASDA
jgi:carbon monoxide dehydrogenase subunit G